MLGKLWETLGNIIEKHRDDEDCTFLAREHSGRFGREISACSLQGETEKLRELTQNAIVHS